MEQVFDPLRKKHVALTPEEGVRQWFISVLQNQLGVPRHMMMSEVALEYGQGVVKKEYRADIVVYGRNLHPLLVVECKRPEVELSREVMDQALRYNAVLDVRFIAVTNGNNSYMCRKGENGLEFVSGPLTYEAMLAEQP